MEVRVQDRRERLLESAVRLFSTRSYSGVSVQEIADDADVAAGLLYYHFTDKQGLYVAALELLARQLRERVEACTDRSIAPTEQLMARLSAHLSFIEEQPDGYRELLRGAASQPAVAAIVERERKERLDRILDGLPDGVRPTAAVVATVEGWLHFVDGVQLAWLESRHLEREQLTDLCGRVLMASLTATIQLERDQDVDGRR